MTVFDLIIVQDLCEQMNNLPPTSHLDQWKDLFAEIKQKCDCKFPDGTSTWVSYRLGNMCQFCSRNDYLNL